MIELGSLWIKTPEAFVEARRKMVHLAGVLGYAEIRASRLATIFSELIRPGTSGKTGVRVRIGLDKRNLRSGVQFLFSYEKKIRPPSGAARFFDTFEIISEEGTLTKFSAFSHFADRSYTPPSDLITGIREMLAQPSRTELLKDLQEKNKELRDSAEQIRMAKDAAEQASEALQHRVEELAEARHAMLNIMEDLGEANRELESAHKQILDSIRYASRIQRAVLPADSMVRQVFPSCMVIWEPRDVVGGDIYWCRPWGAGHLLILGDCTGHGVPGAFMTLIANGALDQALQKSRPADPADLIGHMHRLMQTWLGQDSAGGDSDDGIEIGACYLPPKGKQIVFAGARFTLFYFDGQGDVSEIVGDKKGIGYRAVPHDALFTNKIVEAAPGRLFFLTTDGMIDQVGGEKRRGFGKKQFGKLIARLAKVPLHDQGQYFLEALRNHQGKEKRRDDVSIIGFSLDHTRQ